MKRRSKLLFVMLKYISTLFLSILIAFGVMVLIYALPSDNVVSNEILSLGDVRYGDSHPTLIDHKSFTLDDFVEALMLQYSLTLNYTNDSLVDQALLNYNVKDVTDNITIMPTATLVHLLVGTGNYALEMYGRYWHGYLVFLKPLLMFFTLARIKIIGFFAQFLLLLYAIKLFYEKLDDKIALAFILTIFFINPISTALSLQYYAAYLITLITTIVILKRYDKLNIYYLFCISGIALAFFDLLTFPLVCYGIPLITYLYFSKSKANITIFKEFIDVVKCSISWLFGYAGMWFGKWAIATIVTKEDVIGDAINELLYRTSGDSAEITIIDTLKLNFGVLFTSPFVIVCLLILFITIAFALLRILDTNKIILDFPILLIGLAPIAWYCVVTNHSYVHSYMTYRIISISIYAFFVFSLPRINLSEFKNNFHIKKDKQK